MKNISKTEFVPLYYWAGHKNFGDELSKYIVEKISGKPITYVEEEEPSKLLAIGSVINWKTAYSRSDIWGSGILKRNSLRRGGVFKRIFHNLVSDKYKSRIYATRGPISHQILSQYGFNVPSVFGDPAILMPQFYTPFSEKFGVSRKIGIILHHNIPSSFSIKAPDGFKFISIFREGNKEIEQFVDEVVSCEKIYSVSLHGIIIAQAYGIPATWVQIKNHEIHDDAELKFHDYFLGSGQIDQRPIIVSNLTELIDCNKDFKIIKPFRNVEALLQAFPSKYL